MFCVRVVKFRFKFLKKKALLVKNNQRTVFLIINYGVVIAIETLEKIVKIKHFLNKKKDSFILIKWRFKGQTLWSYPNSPFNQGIEIRPNYK